MIFYSDVFVFHAITSSAQLVVVYHFRAVIKTILAFNFHRPQINDNYGASTFSLIASKIWETIPLQLENYVTTASLNTSSYICLIRNLFLRIY